MIEFIMGIVNWFKDANNLQNVLAVIGAVYTIAFFIVKLTPTKVDDEWLQKIYDVVHKFIGKLGVKK